MKPPGPPTPIGKAVKKPPSTSKQAIMPTHNALMQKLADYHNKVAADTDDTGDYCRGGGDYNEDINGVHCQFYEQQAHLGGKPGTYMYEADNGSDYQDRGYVYKSFAHAWLAAYKETKRLAAYVAVANAIHKADADHRRRTLEALRAASAAEDARKLAPEPLAEPGTCVLCPNGGRGEPPTELWHDEGENKLHPVHADCWVRGGN